MFTKRLEAEFFFCSPLVYLGLSLVVCCFSVRDQNIILQVNKRTITLKHIKVDTTLVSFRFGCALCRLYQQHHS